MLPDFIGIGAQRAGTTWVHNCLKQHPKISLPQKKETQFFNAFYDRGLDWYQSKFTVDSELQVVGEITPDYMYSEVAMKRIVKLIPDIKVFIILRNPFERSYSSYLLFKNNNESNITFRNACENIDHIIGYSLYADAIDRVFNYIPEFNIKIMLYDDLKKNNGVFLDELYEFLGVSKGFRPSDIKVRYNKVMFSSLQNFLITNKMSWIIDSLKKSPLNTFVRQGHRVITENKQKPLNNDDFKYLQKYFYDDIILTQKIIGRNLEFWLKK